MNSLYALVLLACLMSTRCAAFCLFIMSPFWNNSAMLASVLSIANDLSTILCFVPFVFKYISYTCVCLHFKENTCVRVSQLLYITTTRTASLADAWSINYDSIQALNLLATIYWLYQLCVCAHARVCVCSIDRLTGSFGRFLFDTEIQE